MRQQFATKVVEINPIAPQPTIIAEAARLIQSGQVVAFPTETVYGLGANALDSQAVHGIFTAKGRPANDPLIVHIESTAQLSHVAIDIPEAAYSLIERFWPGPLTLVLTRAPGIAAEVSARLPTVAVRMPAHPVALALLKKSGVPIAAPSANQFAHSSPTTAQHVLDDLDGKIPLILDGGPTAIGLESTILDLTATPPRLLRPGGIALSTLAELIPGIEIVTRYATEAEIVSAPGMLLKHYSPNAELHLFDGPVEAVRRALVKAAELEIKQGNQIGFLVAEEDRQALASFGAPIVALGPLADLQRIAQHLFAGLRDLDSQDVQIILARLYPPTGIGLAIRDRLIRAAEGRVTHVDSES